MKIYVAGGWKYRKDIYTKIILPIVEEGHHITHDWTHAENDISNRTPAMNRWFADLDIDAVKRAEILVVYMNDPEYAYQGTWCEIGVALGRGIPIYIITTEEFLQSKAINNVFCSASGIEFFTGVGKLNMHLNFEESQRQRTQS